MDNCVIRAVASANGQNNRVKIIVFEEFIPALLHLEKFSHILVFSALKITNEKTEPVPYAEIKENVMKILTINSKTGEIETEGKLYGKFLIFDIKPYFPIEDRVRKCISSGISNTEDYLSFEKLDNYPINSSINSFNLKYCSIKLIGKIEKGSGFCRIRISNDYLSIIDRISNHSHIRILWYFNRFDGERYRKITQCDPPYEKAPRTGVFASRSPVRPNPIAVTTCEVIMIDRQSGIIEINDTDAFDKSPLQSRSAIN
ncbi:MAG TPA: TrmO family methyltransferase [Spirochaetota bacterium]|nr:TrmO family methyltransferase [Spirochaetota bacterium]